MTSCLYTVAGCLAHRCSVADWTCSIVLVVYVIAYVRKHTLFGHHQGDEACTYGSDSRSLQSLVFGSAFSPALPECAVLSLTLHSSLCSIGYWAPPGSMTRKDGLWRVRQAPTTAHVFVSPCFFLHFFGALGSCCR